MIYVSSITVSPATLSLGVNGSYSLAATVCPTNADCKCLTWSSSNTNVATVNVNAGLVYAKCAGSVTIKATATDGSGKYGTCALTVTATTPVTSVTVTPATTTQQDGWSGQLTATVCPTNATNKCVTWSSSNTNVASVNASTGLIFANNPGTATITATSTDGTCKSGSCTITISPVLVSSVTLNPSSLTQTVGWSGRISATVCPTNASNQLLSWSSSNTSVATVNSNGYVTAVAAGSATITATARDGSGKTGTCSVTVNGGAVVPTTGVTLNPSAMTQNIGWSGYAHARVLPVTASENVLTWSSSNTGVATVDAASGLITAISAGSATITATATDGSGLSGTCSLIVSSNSMTPPFNNNKQSFTDYTANAPGQPVAFTRTYDSMNTAVGPFGLGWSFSYCGSCLASGSVQTVTFPDGTVEHFSVSGSVYTATDTHDTLVKNANGTFTLTTPETTVYSFNASGYLTGITDANSNAVTIALDAATNFPTQITDSVGRTYSIGYDANHLLDQITVNDGSGAAVKTLSYGYTNNRLTAQNNANGQLATAYVYDANGLLWKIRDAWSNDKAVITYQGSAVKTVTDEDGNVTTYFYGLDASGNRLITTVSPNSTPAMTAYDASNRVVLDNGGTAYTYTALGDSSTKTDLSGNVTTYTYYSDAHGNLQETRTVDTGSRVIQDNTYVYTYGGINFVQSVLTSQSTSYDSGSGVTTTTTTTDTYDSHGNHLANTFSDGVNPNQTSSQTYYADGRIHTQTATDSTATTYVYDSYGNPSSITVTPACGTADTTNYTYSMFGQLLILSTSDGVTTNFLYDLLGNVLKQTVIYGGSSRITRVVYDGFGRIMQKISPNEYSAGSDSTPTAGYGLCVSNSYSNQSVGTNYIYDANIGKLTQALVSAYAVNYDPQGTIHNVNAGSATLVTYNYTSDAKRLISTASYGNNYMFAYAYNSDGTVSSLSINGTVMYTYCYYANGVTKTEVATGIVTTSATGEDGSTSVTVKTSGGSLLDSYTISSDGSSFSEYVLGATFGSVHTSTSDNLTATDSFTTNSSQKFIRNNTFDSKTNNLTNAAVKLNSGASLFTAANTYNSKSQLVGRKNTFANCGTEDFGYTYDVYGNIKTVCKNSVLQYTYTYDNVNQLTRADDAVQGKSFVYDHDTHGNILHKYTYAYTTGTLGIVQSTVTYVYDTSWTDKLTSYSGQAITYDALGNPLTYRDGMSFTWKVARQLATASKSGTSVSYNYDDQGIRTSKTVNGVTTNYTTVNGRITSQTDGTNKLYFRYDSQNQLVGVNINGIEYIYVFDTQGDVTKILDMSGNVMVTYAYDAWGVCTVSGGITLGNLNPMRYRSYYYDGELGLYYLQSRYYDPTTGRFVNADEAKMVDSQAFSVNANLFTYCLNNPVMFTDTTGNTAQDITRTAAYWLIGNPVNVLATQLGLFPDQFYFFGFYRDRKGIYHARQNCLQQYGGYNFIYDIVFNYATSMKPAQFVFPYRGREFIFWAWKGNYLNLGAGAELGIYSRLFSTPHWLAETKYAMPMTLKLYCGGKEIINYNPKVDDPRDKEPSQSKWWVTGFNPYAQRKKAEQLTAVYTIDFCGRKDMYSAFYGVWKYNSKWCFSSRTCMATLTF